ncbi:MAG: hypothetical protein RIQ60_3581 [Pseudomonadota bacterium]|jgi:hypothetical protein
MNQTPELIAASKPGATAELADTADPCGWSPRQMGVTPDAPASPAPSPLGFAPCTCRLTPGHRCLACARWVKHYRTVTARLNQHQKARK